LFIKTYPVLHVSTSVADLHFKTLSFKEHLSQADLSDLRKYPSAQTLASLALC
jgi:hypothetical protein